MTRWEPVPHRDGPTDFVPLYGSEQERRRAELGRMIDRYGDTIRRTIWPEGHDDTCECRSYVAMCDDGGGEPWTLLACSTQAARRARNVAAQCR